MNFEEAPLLVIWETTQACDLACVGCRASAMPRRHPDELSTQEGFALLDEVKRFGSHPPFGSPLMVFTGGDPLKRADLVDLMAYSVNIGLRTNINPSPTPLLTAEAVTRFKAIGIHRLAIGLDGADAAMHDRFRQMPGTFERAMAALRHARSIGLESQVQTTVSRRNLPQLPLIAERVAEVQGKMWSLFFLPVKGKGQLSEDLTGNEYEEVFETLYQLSKFMPFEIKTTEAMHYRRYVARRVQQEKPREADLGRKSIARSTGVSDGKGFAFVTHTGEICPSGFLPLSAGNVRDVSLVDTYRDSLLFRALRDTARREGKCGLCEYVKICGGSRARAYAETGNYLAQDPRCTYQPCYSQLEEGDTASPQ